ncbi:MAG: MBL fold metallo-hydrolase [Epsilonproteobacteria bacterium]|nr:hypothetical protein [Campylobacterota bacterium]NPA56990.1 MBL fold metallo-hydrolase [Campylobacterota bacterium]
MRITFLGTSAGRPTKRRNCSAIGLEREGERGWYLFDCAEGTQRQILFSHLTSSRLRGIFITHIHGDHTFGLAGLLTSMKMDGRRESLAIAAPKGVREMVESSIDVSIDNLQFSIEWIEIYGGWRGEFGALKIKALPLMHSVESYAFYIEEAPTVHLDGERLRREGLPFGELY